MGTPRVWFWQRMVSPHMAGLAEALAAAGCEVVYAAEELMSQDRAAQGWIPPALQRAALRLISRTEIPRLVADAPADAIHICQGVRGNGLIGLVQRELAARNRRQWVIMETVEATGWRGWLKRAEYRRRFSGMGPQVERLLAIGHTTCGWVVDRGVAQDKVFPFAYFLPHGPVPAVCEDTEERPLRFGFVGHLIERKRVRLLLEALASIPDRSAALVVIGDGPLSAELKRDSEDMLPGRVQWMGQMPGPKIPGAMTQIDCLVLPSRHDGWGAVISEALMAGTPVVCSDTCGAAGVVRASGLGGVFASGDMAGLAGLLNGMAARGRMPHDQRASLADWARALGTEAGVRYLLDILAHLECGGVRPAPPWETKTDRLLREEHAST